MSDRQAKKTRREQHIDSVRFRRTHPELVDKLRAQIGFLRRSAGLYDQGIEEEAVRLATTIRVLVHRSDGGESLLAQLSLLNVQLPDSSGYDPRNVAPGGAFLTVIIQRGVGAHFEPWLGTHPTQLIGRRVEEWWASPAVRLNTGAILDRSKLVLMIADKEGGAHVDPTLAPEYGAVVRDNAWGWTWGTAASPQGHRPAGDPILATIRHITWELLTGLDSSRDVRSLLTISPATPTSPREG
jgi:hypothetical protein